MKNTERFTVYMTEGERVALRLLARQLGTSENGVIKILIRHVSGLPLSDQYQAQLDALTNSPVLLGQIHR